MSLAPVAAFIIFMTTRNTFFIKGRFAHRFHSLFEGLNAYDDASKMFHIVFLIRRMLYSLAVAFLIEYPAF